MRSNLCPLKPRPSVSLESANYSFDDRSLTWILVRFEEFLDHNLVEDVRLYHQFLSFVIHPQSRSDLEIFKTELQKYSLVLSKEIDAINHDWQMTVN